MEHFFKSTLILAFVLPLLEVVILVAVHLSLVYRERTVEPTHEGESLH